GVDLLLAVRPEYRLRHAVIPQHHVVLDHPDPLRLGIPAAAFRVFDPLQRLPLLHVGFRAVEAALFAVPHREAEPSLRLHVRIAEDARQFHHERRAGSVVIGRFVVAVAVHVRADDVHLVGELGPDFRDVDLVDGTGNDRPGIERADLFVGLRHRIAVDAGAGAIAYDSGASLAAVSAATFTTAARAGPGTAGASSAFSRTHDRRRYARAAFAHGHGRVVLDPPGVGVAVAFELRLNPVHCVAIALG